MNPNVTTLPLMLVAGVVTYVVLAVLTAGQSRSPRRGSILSAALMVVIVFSMIFGFYIFFRGIGFTLTGQVDRLDIPDSIIHWLAYATGIGIAYAIDEWLRSRGHAA